MQFSTNYVVIFILILTGTVAVALTGLREATNDIALRNEDIFNKRAILSAVEDYLPDGKKVNQLKDDEVLSLFDEQINQVTLDMSGSVVDDVKAEDIDMAKQKKKPEAERILPLFIYEKDGEKFYILSVRGNGLWDEIWGNIALESDLNTIAGAAFDHQGETPGLGAEIKDNKSFPTSFKGKKIYDENGDYVSVEVRKGSVKAGDAHAVDGISGATVTGDGVSKMLETGIKYYEPYFETLK